MTDIAAALRSARDALMRTFEDQQATEAYYLVKDAIPAAEAVPAAMSALHNIATIDFPTQHEYVRMQKKAAAALAALAAAGK